MKDIVRSLHTDHVQMLSLLHLVESELNAFKVGEVPDYALLGDILDYVLNYPELCHHPTESMIYRVLQRRAPAEADAIREIEAEHEKITEQTRRFAAAVRNVAADSSLSRDAFVRIGTEFIDLLRRHMAAEEARFFPLALQSLSPRDWAEIEARLALHEGPMFREAIAEPYRALYSRLTSVAP